MLGEVKWNTKHMFDLLGFEYKKTGQGVTRRSEEQPLVVPTSVSQDQQQESLQLRLI